MPEPAKRRAKSATADVQAVASPRQELTEEQREFLDRLRLTAGLSEEQLEQAAEAMLLNPFENRADSVPQDAQPSQERREPTPLTQFTAEDAERLSGVETTHEFPLTATAPGKFAQVRDLDFSNVDFLTSIPETLMNIAIDMTLETEGGKSMDKLTKTDDGEDDPKKLFDLLRKEKELARYMCLIGFVNPKLTETEAEAQAMPGAVWVDRIHGADQIAYLNWIFAPHMQEAQQVAGFPERQV